MKDPTPRELGYRMPAEWEPHAATWLTWPRPEGISFPGAFDRVPGIWANMVKVLSEGEIVNINTFSPEHQEDVEKALAKAGVSVGNHVRLHPFPAYEPWCRDHGPIFVKHATGQVAVVDWRYNAWGGKYPPCDLDDAVPQHVAKLLGMPLFSPDLIMEGGSLEVNGEGTLITTESCLLNPNRNPGHSKEQIEQFLRDYLGVEKILWLGDGIFGDDTDGHVDDLTRFVSADTVVTILEDDPKDENYDRLVENRHRLESMTLADGRPLRIVDLPTPGIIESEGQRLPASYANFYIANDVVLLPVFRHSNDAKAKEILEGLFPSRDVIAVDATDLIWGLGAFHCVTQQQPV